MTIENPPLYMQADTYPARLDRFVIAKLFDEGVMKPTHCKVTQRGAGANFSVDIAIGEFVIQGDDQTNQGSYMGRVTAIENVTVTAAPGANSRYDLVTLLVKDPNAGGAAGSVVTAVVVAGTASASPTVPALPASSIPLAVIGPISIATSSITTALIKDSTTGGMPASAPNPVRGLAGRVCTPGTLELFAGSAVLSGWLYCDGSAVSRTTYAELFATIGTSFGAGDGSTTFNLPNLTSGIVPIPAGGAFTAGAAGGEATHLLTGAESGVANHDHGTYTNVQTADHYHVFSGGTGTESATHTHNVKSASGTYQPFVGFTGSGQNDGVNTLILDGYPSGNAQRLNTDTQSANHTHTFSGTTGGISANHQHQINATGNVNASTAHNNMPPYQVVAGYLIRT